MLIGFIFLEEINTPRGLEPSLLKFTFMNDGGNESKKARVVWILVNQYHQKSALNLKVNRNFSLSFQIQYLINWSFTFLFAAIFQNTKI